MHPDERAIRELMATWRRATAAGDLQALLPLMADDVVFLTPGQKPFGKAGFVAGFQAAIQKVHIDSTIDVQEIQVAGHWAYCWNHLTVTVTPLQEGAPSRRVGYTLTILRRQPDGSWVLARDANLLTAEGATS